jgi:hypothetical protein
MCFSRVYGILASGSLETEGAECAWLDTAIQRTHEPMNRQEPETSCLHRKEKSMSNQPENETLTPQEVRQTLLSEIEASQQAIAELSDEQLEEIAGGIGGATRANFSWLMTQAKLSGRLPSRNEFGQAIAYGRQGARIR